MSKDTVRHKRYSTLENMWYCGKNTKEYLPMLLWWVGISAVVNLLLPILEMYLPKIVIEEITAGSSLQRLLLLLLLATFSLALLRGFSKFCEKFVYRQKILMGSYYIHKISQKGLTTDYCNRESEEFRTLQQESYSLCSSYESALRNIYYLWISFFAGVVGLCVYGVLLGKLHVVLLLFLAVTAVGGYFAGLPTAKWAEEHNKERAGYHHKLQYVDSVAEDIRSAKDIRLYQMEAWLQRIYKDHIEKIANWYRRYDRIVLKTSFFNSSISLLREGVAYGYLIYLSFQGKLSAGDFVLYFAVITGFSGLLQGLIGQLIEMRRISGFVTRFRSYLDYPETFQREGGVSTEGKLAAPCQIQLKNVCYRYPGADTDTLHNINLTIPPGEHLGIVGLNGAGKTTLVKLLCGLIDPTEGEVLYDGVNIKDYHRIEFYRLFSAVFQQYSLLALSIEEAVAETTADRVDHGRIQECLTKAGIWDKIAALPNGTKSLLNKSINDNAVAFSGGEIQKLLLARAIYKDAPILLLDEPTAALDPVAENRLYENYHTITHQKTSIFISHRLASTRFCHRILLLNEGHIQEVGTHSELLESKKLYYTLFETQANYYRNDAESEVSEDENADQ